MQLKRIDNVDQANSAAGVARCHFVLLKSNNVVFTVIPSSQFMAFMVRSFKGRRKTVGRIQMRILVIYFIKTNQLFMILKVIWDRLHDT